MDTSLPPADPLIAPTQPPETTPESTPPAEPPDAPVVAAADAPPEAVATADRAPEPPAPGPLPPPPQPIPVDLSRVAQDLQIRKVQVEAVVQLLDDGNTIPLQELEKLLANPIIENYRIEVGE